MPNYGTVPPEKYTLNPETLSPKGAKLAFAGWQLSLARVAHVFA